MEYSRTLDLGALLRENSHFLLGPRGTGKSYWIRHSLPGVQYFDLLDEDVYARLLRRPRQLGEEVADDAKIVVVDEIQRVPPLLNEVHRILESTGRPPRFLLTGSSARRLKGHGANLLAGRVWEQKFFPLTTREIPKFKLLDHLNWGGLPRVLLSRKPALELKNYVNLYLREEIKFEALVRKYDAFVRFLDALGTHNGEELVYQNLSNDSGVAVRTVESYVEVLEDTLTAFQVPPFLATKSRKAITRSKLYFFDLGVARHLARLSEIQADSEPFGAALEHFVALEIRAYLELKRRDHTLHYWRTKNGFEVDFVIGNRLALEVKASKRTHPSDLRNLKALREEGLVANYALVSLDPVVRKIDGIQLWPVDRFLDRLWNGELF